MINKLNNSKLNHHKVRAESRGVTLMSLEGQRSYQTCDSKDEQKLKRNAQELSAEGAIEGNNIIKVDSHK